MFTLNVKADVASTVAYLNRVKDGLGSQVITASLNKTIATVNTQMVRGIAQTYNVKQSDIRDKLSIQKARRAGENFEAILYGNPYGRKRRALNLIHFLQTRKTLAAYRRKGARGRDVLQFQIIKGKTVTVPGAFILNVPGSPVFHRTGVGRKAIEPLYTVGIPQMFMAHKVQDPVQAMIPVEFAKQFEQAFRYFLSTAR
jgi:hypothetical protein